MKRRKRSVKFNITLTFSIAMIIVAILTFLLIRVVSQNVLEANTSQYLMGAVESNADKIKFAKKKNKKLNKITKDIAVEYKKGYLIIDRYFLEEMKDVQIGLYDKDGNILYGKNPLTKDKEIDFVPSFSVSRVYKQNINKTPYYIYDRKLIGKKLNGVWMRGMVPLTNEMNQLASITKVAAMFLPIIIILAIVFGLLISRKLLKPVNKMEEAASSISQGSDLKKRIDIGNGSGEIYDLADDFNEMISRLDDSFESEKRFISDASHELRTPMSVIMAQTELTLEKDRSAEEYKSAIEVIERQGGRMNTLIDTLLDYTRLEQRADEYQMMPVDLSDLVSSLCQDMKLIKLKDITLEYDVDPDITISGHKVLLTRMLQNLIDNAYKYGNDGGNIWVSLKDNKDNVILSVKDNGIGIDEKNVDKIFDRFFREDTSRTHSKRMAYGYGLGLSMVKKIVEMHNANIRVISEEGKGSEFKIYFKK
ncbi:MAG: HAMP domain-containing histidine kinase [Eubacterium sp.]|nr:HAMP domain-containing histidine kinase [Eubacterium sp.]